MVCLTAPLHLRAPQAADQPFLDALFRSTREELAQAAPDEAFLLQLLRIQQNAEAQGMRACFPHASQFIIEHDGVAAGRLVFDSTPDALHLVDLTLLPGARGQGHGGAILDALQDQAAAHGQTLTLKVSLGNTGARRLYGRKGFAVTSDDGMQQALQWRPA